jgi:hypothetical protein
MHRALYSRSIVRLEIYFFSFSSETALRDSILSWVLAAVGTSLHLAGQREVRLRQSDLATVSKMIVMLSISAGLRTANGPSAT